ncbi:MAG: YjhG/YagF family D-xylonate dehydratase [bacterium]|nr:YjhG/YagF family D-xylonate dehydratase [bacterium]
MSPAHLPSRTAIFGSDTHVDGTRTRGEGAAGSLPLTESILLDEPSGNLFGMTQAAAMGWNPEEVGRDQYVIVSTHGGLRAEDGSPIALGYHTGHWEVNLLVREAAHTLKANDAIPFAVYVTDPCDGRTQGTDGMMDSLPYRNDAAIVARRLIRSLPTRDGVMGIGTCDKGLPAVMIALAGFRDLPGIVVPGGVTLPAIDAEDAGMIQTIGARFTQGMISLDYAAAMGCRACGSGGGGCQFLGTAATSQVVAEGFGLSLPHSALSPSGERIWLDMAHRSALALIAQKARRLTLGDILTPKALENAMLIHAAFGGSTNLLLHIPAVAHQAGLPPPTVQDWVRVNRAAPRMVDALPNGPRNFPTVQVFMAGGVPEVMLHLRRMGVLHTDVLTASGETLDTVLDWWQESERRQAVRRLLARADQVDPDDVIMDADTARRKGLTSTVIFPVGNLAPQGSVVKATSIDPSRVGADQVFHHRGNARVFTSEAAAIQAVKGRTETPVKPGDIMVLIGLGPLGTGMVETAQITSALKYLEWGKHVSLLTDGRFSGFSTGACIGHIGPEALAGGPLGKVRDGDTLEIRLDRVTLEGTVHLVATPEDGDLTPEAGARVLANRPIHPGLQAHPRLPDDSRLWAALQRASGGTWAGCIYDVDRIIAVLEAGMAALESA